MSDDHGKSLKSSSVTPELIKVLIDEACDDIQSMFGEDAALFYRAGILDAMSLIHKIKEMQDSERAIDLYQAFASTKKSTGGIN